MDKNKPMAAPKKPLQSKRPSTVSTASSSRNVLTTKEKINRAKVNKNATIIGSGDITMCKNEQPAPNFDAEYREIAYGRFLRAMLEDCLVDEKISREETQMDIQMAQLADRFHKTIDQLDKTNKRLKDISFVVEQKRLLNLKNRDCNEFYNITEGSKVEELLENLSIVEKAKLDRLETKNVDFGYCKESGHKQLLDAVNDAIEGLEEIKKHSNLDIEKLKEYERTQNSLDEVEKDRLDLESLKSELDAKLPRFSEKVLMEASEKFAAIINKDEESVPI